MFTIYPFQKTYENKTVLNFPGFSLEPGRIYAVIGSNGSGKSTLARILSGVEKPDPPASLVCSGSPSIGYLPQKPYGFRMTLRKNLLLNRAKQETPAFAAQKADAFIRDFDLEHLASANGSRLSGGETARMALARLMMKDYELVILDEPTASIDRNNTLKAEQAIRTYTQRTKAATLLITHSLKQARRLADTVLYLENGTLAEFGPTDAILTHPSTEHLEKFLDFYDSE